MNTAPSAVTILNSKPHLELLAPEVAFRIDTASGKPIFFHMRPYSFDEIKAGLRALKGKIKDTGTTLISQDGDPAALLPLFDVTFLRMSNVILNPGDSGPPSIEDQRAWLDRNPRLKARVVNEGFCTVFLINAESGEDIAMPGVSVNGKPVDAPVVLDELLPIDTENGAVVEYVYRLHAPATNSDELVRVRHQFEPETAQDYNIYDRASRREIEKGSGFQSVDVDHDRLNKLYDRTIRGVDGFLVGGLPCTAANKAVWTAQVPYYHKLIALDARFADVTKKNN